MSFERSVKRAIDEISGEIIDADENFNADRESHIKYREAFNKGEFLPKCLACKQYLSVKSSSNDRIFFSHKPNSDYCELKDENLSKSEREKTEEIYASKESPEHKYLKNKIGELLKKTKDIDKNSIQIDSEYLFSDERKRRKPDVYCKFRDKALGFEVQLSTLTQRYILDRTRFYRDKGVYLIWILENFDTKKQSKMKKDLKYATLHENFFKLDQNFSNELKLSCKYKKVTNVTDQLDVYKKWEEKSISLDQLNFDEENYQCFYYNFKVEVARSKSEKIRSEIAQRRNNESITYSSVHEKIQSLKSEEIDILNNELQLYNLLKNGKPVLNYYIQKSKESAFIQFLLECELINIQVNNSDENGTTALQEIIYNNHLHRKKRLIKLLFIREYEFIEADKKAILEGITDRQEADKLITLCNLSSGSPRRVIHLIFEHEKLFYVLESIRKNRIIGFNYDPDNNPGHWIAFINNAIDNYTKHWPYIEAALRAYGLWDKILELDKKDTFKEKLKDFHSKDFKPENLNSNIGYLYRKAHKELNRTK